MSGLGESGSWDEGIVPARPSRVSCTRGWSTPVPFKSIKQAVRVRLTPNRCCVGAGFRHAAAREIQSITPFYREPPAKAPFLPNLLLFGKESRVSKPHLLGRLRGRLRALWADLMAAWSEFWIWLMRPAWSLMSILVRLDIVGVASVIIYQCYREVALRSPLKGIVAAAIGALLGVTLLSVVASLSLIYYARAQRKENQSQLAGAKSKLGLMRRILRAGPLNIPSLATFPIWLRSWRHYQCSPR